MGLVVFGSVCAFFAFTHWTQIVIAAKNSTATAAGMFVASGGITLIGALLVYAGIGKKQPPAILA